MPALGRPTSPASAISFSRSQTQRSSPGQPLVDLRGARLVEVLKWALPKPPSPPRSSVDALAGRVHVGEHRFLVVGEDLGADGTLMTTSCGACAGAVRAGAVAALGRAEMLGVAEIDQRIEVVFGDEDDVAALAAVAAVRAAELDELLPPERDHAVAAVAGAQVDLGLVEKFHDGVIQKQKRGPACTDPRPDA